MLKPKRKIVQKELKKDPLIEGIYQAQKNWEKNSKLYIRLGFGAVAVVLVVLILARKSRISAEEADIALSRAIVLKDQGDVDNALLEFELIQDDYGSTKGGSIAKFYLGQIYFNSGDFDLAKSYLEEFIRKPKLKLLKATGYQLLGKISESVDDLETALSHYQNAVSASVVNEERNKHSLALASVYIRLGQNNDARELLEPIIDENNRQNPSRLKAEQLMGQIFMGE